LFLNQTAVPDTATAYWNDTSPTADVFSVGTTTVVNTLNNEYIAYCFADLEGVSKIGSYTGTGAADLEIACGFQPAYVMIKRTDSTGYWTIWDNKRDTHNPNTQTLLADVTDVEASGTYILDFTSTGFTIQSTSTYINADGGEYIFLAFAELPTKDSPENHNLPLFGQIAYTGDGAAEHNISGLPFKPDLVWGKSRTQAYSHQLFDSMRGAGLSLVSDTTAAQLSDLDTLLSFNEDGVTLGADVKLNTNAQKEILWCWNAGGELVPNLEGSIESSVMVNVQGGFSIVKYTGSGANATIGHGLDSAPEMIIVKGLTNVDNWLVYVKAVDATAPEDYYLLLNQTNARGLYAGLFWNSTAPTDSVFSVDATAAVNQNTVEFIAYCFHSVAGMSDFGSYTGTGVAGLEISCGFKVDWVLIRRTDGVADWLVFDVKSGGRENNTSCLFANTSAAETVGRYDVDFTDDGFIIQVDGAGLHTQINANNGTYIYMAFKAGDNPDTLHQTETGDLQISSESGSIVDDNGTHTITNTGVTVGSTDPACGTYDMVFDGSSYLSLPDHNDWDFGSGDFTVDWWENPITAPDGVAICLGGNGSTIYCTLVCGYSSAGTNIYAYASSNGSSWDQFSGVIMGEQSIGLVHRALVRSSNVLYAFQNGILITAVAYSGTMGTVSDASTIGNWAGTKINAYLDHVRITKGTALWTTTNFNLTDKGLFYPKGTLNV